MNWISALTSKQIVTISAATALTTGIYLFRDNFRGKEFEKDVNCKGKVAIVTGGNSGIGKETARELAKRGCKVYLLCRDMTKCNAARKAIILTSKNRKVYARECDLASLDSVKKFSDKFHEEESRLDILINNAGIWRAPYGKTKDGFETHLGVNHLGHFYLTNLVLDLLKKSAPSRIVNVTAATYVNGTINKEDLNSESEYSQKDAYNQSKLANVLFTLELAERLKGTGVTANAVNPGVTSSNLYWRHGSGMSFTVANVLIQPFTWIFFKSCTGGAQTSLYAALDPDLENVTGKYFSNCEEEEIKPEAKDSFTAKWLWAVSEKWTQLKNVLTDESAVTS